MAKQGTKEVTGHRDSFSTILSDVNHPGNYCGDNTMTLKEARAENTLFFELILAMI
jgi:hypothetical protein